MLKATAIQWRATALRASALSVVADYISLTKPPIVLLLLVTALGGAFVAAQGVPPLSATLLLMVGGAAAAGGAGAVNQYMDRDIDEVMSRTRRRPVPGRRISGGAALTFGVLLNLFSFVLLSTGVNLLTAVLTMSGTLFYVFVYTWWLKRTTPQNIVIGGAAGSLPPLAGWAAVTGGLEPAALCLFGIIFLWTPSHFWALALLIREDYERAGIPMLPVVKGVAATRRGILVYTAAVVALSLLTVATQILGWVYLASALVLGVAFLALAWRAAVPTRWDGEPTNMRAERTLYLYSLAYLALIFVAMMVDSVVGL